MIIIQAVIDAFNWIINFFTDIWEFISSMISSLVLAFRYIFIIIELAISTIGNLPDWLQAFGLITITISGVYFVIGREAGKTE